MKYIIKISLQIILILCIFTASASEAVIRGYYPSLNDGDIIQLTTNIYGNYTFPTFTEVSVTNVKNHSFEFHIHIGDVPLEIELLFEDKTGFQNSNYFLSKALKGFYIESGDNISIAENNNRVEFTGEGSPKFRVMQRLKTNQMQAFSALGISFTENPMANLKITDSLVKRNLDYLQSEEKVLSRKVFIMYKAYLIAGWLGRFSSYDFLPDSSQSALKRSLKLTPFNQPFTINDVQSLNEFAGIAYSAYYSSAILSQYKFDSCRYTNSFFSAKSCYRYLKLNYSGALLERLVTEFLFKYRTGSGNNSELVNDALSWVKQQDFVAILNDLKNHRMASAPSFNFSLVDNNGQTHKMDDYAGKVVFMDYWFTGCANCILLTPYMTELEDYFKGKPVVFLSINTDRTKEEWLKSILTGKYTTKSEINLFTGGKGFNSDICKYYNINAGPTVILIDRNGKIMEAAVDPRIDNCENVKQLINEKL